MTIKGIVYKVIDDELMLPDDRELSESVPTPADCLSAR